MDSKIGKGFYHRIKSAEYEPESMLSLLREVQEKRYTYDASQNDQTQTTT